MRLTCLALRAVQVYYFAPYEVNFPCLTFVPHEVSFPRLTRFVILGLMSLTPSLTQVDSVPHTYKLFEPYKVLKYRAFRALQGSETSLTLIVPHEFAPYEKNIFRASNFFFARSFQVWPREAIATSVF